MHRIIKHVIDVTNAFCEVTWSKRDKSPHDEYEPEPRGFEIVVFNRHDFDEHYGYRPPMEANLRFHSAKEIREFAQKILELVPKPTEEKTDGR